MEDESKSRVVWCGNISSLTTENQLYELFLQAGPLENVNIPKDREGKKRNFAFITFKHEISVPYAIELLNGINLNGRPLRLDGRSGARNAENPYTSALEKRRTSNSSPTNRRSHDKARESPQSNRYEQQLSTTIARTNEVQPAPAGNWAPQQVWEQNPTRWPADREQRGFSFQMTSFSTGRATFPQITPQEILMYGQHSLYPWDQTSATLGLHNTFMPNFPGAANYWSGRR